MFEFKIKLAQKNILLKSRFELCQTFCKDYLSDFNEQPDIIAQVTENEVQNEIAAALEETTPEYAECLCLYRKIAEKLPQYSCFVMHGAAITCDNNAIIFTAPSGTGKTTHIKNWKRQFNDRVDIINGDKPILKVGESSVTVYSSPWAGKEKFQKNRSAPLKAICILKRAEQNRTYKVNPKEHLAFIMHQIYLPKDEDSARKTLALCSKLLSDIPVYIVECNMSAMSAQVAFDEIFG